MKRSILIALLGSTVLAASLSAAPLQGPPLPATKERPIRLIEEGQPKAVILLPSTVPPSVAKAVEAFVSTLREATGVELPVRPEAEAAGLGKGVVKIFVGDTKEAAARGLRSSALAEESYRIIAEPGQILLLGRDKESDMIHYVDSLPTRWALNQLLDQYLGVRWLWPGKLGTHIPKATSFAVPEMDVTYQPDLLLRRLRLIPTYMNGAALQENGLPPLLEPEGRERLMSEAVEWLKNHQGGQRGRIRFGHAFADWWQKYSAAHPDYFAVPPRGIQQPKPNEKSVKLRLANPAVVEQIAAEYTEKDAPAFYNICPNDGYGFDTSAETRQWDVPADQKAMDIWSGKANLTARHVHFWNRVYERLSQINPDVTLISYAYASYRTPPPPEVPLRARMIIAVVDSFSAYDAWQAWSDTGAKMILRPNWWIVGADAPHIPLRRMSRFVHHIRKNNLVGIDKDSICGYWATQGLNYYALARLIERPDLSRDEIVAEYASAFGPAAEHIRAYIDYWEDLTDKAAYPNHAGSIVSENPDGIYERLVREKGIPFNPRLGSLWIMPHLYGDEALAKGSRFLDEADAALSTPDDATARERVAFLRAGLEELRAIRDVIATVTALKERPEDAALLAEYEKRSEALLALRKRHASTHVVWGEKVYVQENKLKIPTLPRNLGKAAPDLRGM